MRSAAGSAVIALAMLAALTACSVGSPAPTPGASSVSSASSTPSAAVPSSTPAPLTAAAADGVLTIGTLLPASGDLRFLGGAPLLGVKAAVREINAAGGVGGKKVRLVSRDSADGTPKASAKALRGLIKAKVDVVIGPASSSLVLSLLPVAAKAGVPFVSPAATFSGLTSSADAPFFSRTIPAYSAQSRALAVAIPAKARSRVAVVYSGVGPAASLAQALPAALTAGGGEVVASVAVKSKAKKFASVISTLRTAKPTAVVLATTGGATVQTRGLLAALKKAGLAGSRLWLTSQNLADYSQALPKGTLTKVNGVLEGVAPSAAFRKKLGSAASALPSLRYAAEAYDATILAALAAQTAGMDAADGTTASLADQVRADSTAGITCATWAECTEVLKTDSDIDYGGLTGTVDVNGDGDVTSFSYGVYRYSASGTFSRVRSVLVD